MCSTHSSAVVVVAAAAKVAAETIPVDQANPVCTCPCGCLRVVTHPTGNINHRPSATSQPISMGGFEANPDDWTGCACTHGTDSELKVLVEYPRKR
ncbi:hypothetical protein G7046_g1581 [Stylonectria norvegica]|nr:hypothetical protein G7046_g1581 [Stylonectria norvegica]